MQLSEIQFEEVVLAVNQHIMKSMFDAQKLGTVDEYLATIGLHTILDKYRAGDQQLHFNKKGKILICGGTKVKEAQIQGIAKYLNINQDRLECILDYEKTKKIDFRKVQYNTDYCLILFGAVPHKTVSTDGYGSVISAVQNNDGYPPVVVVGKEYEPKITKSNLKKVLEKALIDGTIESDK